MLSETNKYNYHLIIEIRDNVSFFNSRLQTHGKDSSRVLLSARRREVGAGGGVNTSHTMFPPKMSRRLFYSCPQFFAIIRPFSGAPNLLKTAKPVPFNWDCPIVSTHLVEKGLIILYLGADYDNGRWIKLIRLICLWGFVYDPLFEINQEQRMGSRYQRGLIVICRRKQSVLIMWDEDTTGKGLNLLQLKQIIIKITKNTFFIQYNFYVTNLNPTSVGSN